MARGYEALSRTPLPRWLAGEWAQTGRPEKFPWRPVPRRLFWRPRWARAVYDGKDWHVEFATDVQAARTYLEETFGGR